MPWHKSLPFPGSEVDDTVADWEKILVGPEGSILEDVNLQSSAEIQVLVLVLASKLGPSFKSTQLDAASKKDNFDILVAAANNIIEMTRALEEQAERENCNLVTWHNILNMALRWPYESAEDLMDNFYNPSSLQKQPPTVPAIGAISSWTAVNNKVASPPSRAARPRDIHDSQEERGYIDENENNDPVSEVKVANGTNQAEEEDNSDPEDFSEYDRKYSENPNWDLQTPPKQAPSKTDWILTEGQDWSTAKLNQPDFSKFVIFRSSVDGKINEIRQLPWWASFDWSDRKHIDRLIKWRLQLFRRSGGEQKKPGNAWTQKEHEMFLQYSKEVIALGLANTRGALFDAVAEKLNGFFKDFLQKEGEPLASSGVLKKDRLGVKRDGKTLSNQATSTFQDVNDLAKQYVKDVKKRKSAAAAAAKKSKAKSKSDGAEVEKDGEEGGDTESKPVTAKKVKNKRKMDEVEEEGDAESPKPAKKARKASAKRAVVSANDKMGLKDNQDPTIKNSADEEMEFFEVASP